MSLRDASEELIADWLTLFIGTGLDVGIRPEQMVSVLRPEKLKGAIALIAEQGERRLKGDSNG